MYHPQDIRERIALEEAKLQKQIDPSYTLVKKKGMSYLLVRLC